MKVNRFEDASQFYERVKDYLLSQEALHILLLRICNTLIHHPQRYDCQPYLATVEIDGNIVAVAIRTPPRRLLLSKVEKFAAIEAIAQDLYSDHKQLPGVSGLAAEAFAFAQTWQTITNQSYTLGKQLRIHQLDKVQRRNLLLSKIENFESIKARCAQRSSVCAAPPEGLAIAQDIYLSEKSLSGVNAPTAEAEAFAQAWHSLTGQSYHLKMALRAFQLEQVQPIFKATGELRLATRKSDRELLIRWYEAFALEALGTVESKVEPIVERLLQLGIAYIWEDKIPVSMACHVRVTPNGAGVSVVYTPPEHRRKGYASACVAALSQTLLNQGNRYCFLFTDLANPTSNHIYEAIGYQPVGDLFDYSFSSF
ncbi:GNAT family N-acetyltransferase [Brasilonema sp. UFV-L1]|uniref:GNAT family N-acetyltransferase n=1 Tax=Brasilonema sp. UFV-L1 TaxID=2234130 RepID=UPI00145D99BF|nr:GNAT family N-acetyltransferase [Brasilonema sp. UFV-L1]NMG11196.1 hypothetical protein [Brasilonema sp. UFV-L1]